MQRGIKLTLLFNMTGGLRAGAALGGGSVTRIIGSFPPNLLLAVHQQIARSWDGVADAKTLKR